MTAPPLDVLVVGGGTVGACVGALLARAGAGALRVGLLQSAAAAHSAAEPPPGAPPDARVVAVSRASERILSAAGAWALLRPHAWAYERMCVWHEGMAASGDEVLQFDAAEVGEPNLGYIIEARRVTAALMESYREAGGQVISGELQGVIAAASGPGARAVLGRGVGGAAGRGCGRCALRGPHRLRHRVADHEL